MPGVDDVSEFRWQAEMLAFFGVRRMTEVFAMSIMIGLSGKTLPSEIVAALKMKGISRDATYRALADMRRFNQHLEEKYGEVMSYTDLLLEIHRVSLPISDESKV